MELYLDSANLTEIEKAFELGFIHGLTTTPTFMKKEDVKDVNSTIIKLAKIAPILQIEAIGNNFPNKDSTANEIIEDVLKLIGLGLDKQKTVFKIPMTLEGAKACYRLKKNNYRVNLHLINTIQQMYIALNAGADYVCPLVGRLQDRGYDALGFIKQSLALIDRYDYKSKLMFSSVRTFNHVKDALDLGVHTCTIPWKILKQMGDNVFTNIDIKKFKADMS